MKWSAGEVGAFRNPIDHARVSRRGLSLPNRNEEPRSDEACAASSKKTALPQARARVGKRNLVALLSYRGICHPAPQAPNPLRFHRVTARRIGEKRHLICPMTTIDGTPVVDIKPVLSRIRDS